MQDSETFANRDDPIPLIRVPTEEDGDQESTAGSSYAPSQETDSPEGLAKYRWRDQAGRIKDKLGDRSMQDRFFAGIMSQIIPPEELQENTDADESKVRKEKPDRRSKKYVDRPEFGPALMAANFKRFNSRIGIIFVLENRLIHLFTWQHPTATLSFLALYSLFCLNPHLLPLLPLAALLFTIMIPSFLARHPVSANDPRIEPSLTGPAVAPPSRVKPAPEFSRDFFRNMRDLQNSMEDFSRLHDLANTHITPHTNFSSESASSTLFLLLTLLSCTLFLTSHLLPWRLLALTTGVTLTCSLHPQAQTHLLTPPTITSLTTYLTTTLKPTLTTFSTQDIALDAPPETRSVEIFELQRFAPETETWEPHLFAPKPYTPASPARVAGREPQGAAAFEAVRPPAGGWEWAGGVWRMDFDSAGWVEGRGLGSAGRVWVEGEGGRWVVDVEGGWRRRRWTRGVRRGRF